MLIPEKDGVKMSADNRVNLDGNLSVVIIQYKDDVPRRLKYISQDNKASKTTYENRQFSHTIFGLGINYDKKAHYDAIKNSKWSFISYIEGMGPMKILQDMMIAMPDEPEDGYDGWGVEEHLEHIEGYTYHGAFIDEDGNLDDAEHTKMSDEDTQQIAVNDLNNIIDMLQKMKERDLSGHPFDDQIVVARAHRYLNDAQKEALVGKSIAEQARAIRRSDRSSSGVPFARPRRADATVVASRDLLEAKPEAMNHLPNFDFMSEVVPDNSFTYDKDFVIDFEDQTVSSMLAMIVTLNAATKYVGYVGKITRRAVRSMSHGNFDYAQAILAFSYGLTRIGNNTTKLGKKRVNKKQAAQILTMTTKFQVKARAKEKEDLTLPRIGLAFAAEHFMVRKYLTDEMQNLVENDVLDSYYQDLSFVGIPAINSLQGFEEFNKEISMAIYKAKGSKNARRASDEYGLNEDSDGYKEFLKDHKHWTKIATDGYKSETEYFKRRMQAAINWTPTDERRKKQEVMAWIGDGFDGYNTNDWPDERPDAMPPAIAVAAEPADSRKRNVAFAGLSDDGTGEDGGRKTKRPRVVAAKTPGSAKGKDVKVDETPAASDDNSEQMKDILETSEDGAKGSEDVDHEEV